MPMRIESVSNRSGTDHFSQPYTVAFQTELLEIKARDEILEIGTGSGCQASILRELWREVHTIEYNKVLYNQTRKFLPRLGYRPHFYQGDGSRGLPATGLPSMESS